MFEAVRGAIRLGPGTLRLRGALVVAADRVVCRAARRRRTVGQELRRAAARSRSGFRPENVLVVRATVPGGTPKDANRYFKDVLDRISSLPGVMAAGATMAPPGHVESEGAYYVDSDAAVERRRAIRRQIHRDAWYIRRARDSRGAGRDFDERDGLDAPFTAVINEALARTSLPRRGIRSGERSFVPSIRTRA